MAYQRPMVTVDQNITIAPTSIEREQPAFVFGPNYELHRYSDAEEKPKTSIGLYDAFEHVSSPMIEAYPGAVDGEAVDSKSGYTKLTGDNVMLKLADLGVADLPERNVPQAVRDANGGFTKLLFSGKAYIDYNTEGGNDPAARNTLPKNLSAGDMLLITYGSGANQQHVKSSIVAVQYSDSGWQLDDDSPSEGGAGTLVTIEDAIPEGAVDGGDVSVELVMVDQDVEFTRKNLYKYENEIANPGYQWVEGAILDGQRTVYGVKVNELYADVTGYFDRDTLCKVIYADLYVTFRELVTSYSDSYHSVVGASEVANALGAVDPANPLAMGVYMAALNAATDDGDQSPPVYFMATPTDDVDGYAAVLNKATLTDRAYVFAPTTRDDAVLDLVKSHVLEMSTKTVKMWRIAAASADIPEEVARLSSADNVAGKGYFAIPVKSDASSEVYDRLRVVKSTEDQTGNPDVAFRSTIVPGDIVRFGYRRSAWAGEPDTYDTYVVKNVVNNYTVQIKLKEDEDGNVTGIPYSATPSKIEIYHPYTRREYADVVASTSKHMASRRMINVFPSQFKDNGVLMTGEFAACAVAGLVSATEPQQPITNVTVNGIDDIPMVYQTYNNVELDIMAAGGTFIIMQDLPNDRVYVRHQITTAYSDGNLNTAELSITKNVDSISYAFAEVFRPYYGKYNITPDLIAGFRNLASQLCDQFAGSDSVYGPQLISEETSIQYVRQNALMKDRVDVGIRLGVPYPCNNIDIVLTV